MIPDTFQYAAPATLAEAVAVLATDPANVPLAGGNGLLTLLKRGELAPTTVVDLRRLDVLRGIAVTDDGHLRVGALTTLTDLCDHPIVRAAHIPGVLGDAVDSAGDQQARNRATIGGTLASAAPGSDVSAALLVLDATADIAGPNGSRVATVAGMLDGSESLTPGELITAVTLAPAEPGSAYCRLANRANLHAICGVAVTIALGRNGTIARCRIAVTGALSHPQRLTGSEASVIGTKPPVAISIHKGLYFVDDAFASAAYREHLTGTLAERAFASAIARARNA